MEDFDFSMEYNIVIRWTATNLTCHQASQKNNTTKYACRSFHSYCKDVTRGKIFMGYRCKCSSGFHGNPYIQDGCTGSYLPYASNIICPLHWHLLIFAKVWEFCFKMVLNKLDWTFRHNKLKQFVICRHRWMLPALFLQWHMSKLTWELYLHKMFSQ
jgi:hypothetical protein